MTLIGAGDGNGTEDTILDAGGVPVTTVTIDTGCIVTLRGLRITGALADIVNQDARGIRNDGNLTMTNCTVTGNTAFAAGGGIRNHSQLQMSECTVSDNHTLGSQLGGGGIYNQGTLLALESCLVEHNTTPAYGGGLYVESGEVTLDQDCRVRHNTANSGGGIFNVSGSVELQGSTPSNIVTNNCPNNCAGTTQVDQCAPGGSCP